MDKIFFCILAFKSTSRALHLLSSHPMVSSETMAMRHLDSKSILAMLLLGACLLQGCADSSLRQVNVFLAIMAGLFTGGVLICGCMAMSFSPAKAERQMKYGCAPMCLLTIIAWVGFGVLNGHLNCELLKSMDTEKCEWREPLPMDKFSYEECCIETSTTPAP